MNAISITELRKVLASGPLRAAEDRIFVRSVCTDTRQMSADSLFFAIVGDNFDGHDYLATAAAKGAVAAVVQRDPDVVPQNLPLVHVPESRRAMGKLAAIVRTQLRARVIAVAGSNGKTTTKHLIDAALRPNLRGSVSPKSFNNDIGVPLTIFPADALQDYLVLEIGTNHPGEISHLSRISRPDIAVITNCSAEHLEGLVDLDGVRRENASVAKHLSQNGLLIVNGDDEELLCEIARHEVRPVTFGFMPHNDLFAMDVQSDESGTRFALSGSDEPFFVPLLGKHTACNALAAIGVGRAMGLSDSQIRQNLNSAKGPEMRLSLEQCGDVRVLNDAYNANPASMKAALETLSGLATDGRRVAFVGEMRELGDAARELHEEMGRTIARDFPPDLLVCVGPLGQAIAAEARRAGLAPERVECFPDAASACVVTRKLRRGDLILLKGSRTVRLETVAKAIQRERTTQNPA